MRGKKSGLSFHELEVNTLKMIVSRCENGEGSEHHHGAFLLLWCKKK